MHLRLKKYFESPRGVWCRLKRDIPYLLRGTSYYASCKLQTKPHSTFNKCSISVDEYLARKNQRTAQSVIYTCITADYDDITRIACPSFIECDCDYVCYTDNSDDVARGQIGVWQLRPLVYAALDSTRNNRWHKMHPHKLFPEYSDSLYIDANVDILSPSLMECIRSMRSCLAIPAHPLRDCIYDEYENAFAEFIDSPRIMKAELDLIKGSGMPRHFGLTENNIIYRQHNTPQIIEIMDEWWCMTSNYSRRDQLSLAWILWKQGIKISDITIQHWHSGGGQYYVFPHQRRPHRVFYTLPFASSGNTNISPQSKS